MQGCSLVSKCNKSLRISSEDGQPRFPAITTKAWCTRSNRLVRVYLASLLLVATGNKILLLYTLSVVVAAVATDAAIVDYKDVKRYQDLFAETLVLWEALLFVCLLPKHLEPRLACFTMGFEDSDGSVVSLCDNRWRARVGEHWKGREDI